jgi:hypothetical protein
VINAANGIGVSGFAVSFSGGSTTTDATGKYLFSSVPQGIYNVTAARTGWLSALGSVTVFSGTPAVLDLRTSTAGKIGGNVRSSSGSTIPGTVINMQGGVLGINGNVTANGSGHYDSGWIAIGTYTFTATATGFFGVQRTVSVATGVVGAQDFVLSPDTQPGTGTLQGKVTDARNGAGLSNATVSFNSRSTLTNSTGNYVFTGVAGGNYNVTATRTGFLARTLPVTVANGTPATLNIPISVAGKLVGTAKTAGGAAISGVSVTCNGGVIPTTKTATTNIIGVFECGWVPVGSYTVTATQSGLGTKSTVVTLSTGQTLSVPFVF